MKKEENKNVGVGMHSLMGTITGSNSISMGVWSGSRITTGQNNTLIGFEAGLNLTTESNVVIIGDYIHDLDRSKENVVFIGDRVVIGKTLFGKPLNFFDLKNDIIKSMKEYTDSRNKKD